MINLSTPEIENIIRRSYQYVAMYNVNNKFAMQQNNPLGPGGWNQVMITVDGEDYLASYQLDGTETNEEALNKIASAINDATGSGVTATVEVVADETVTTGLRIPSLAELVVQAFPSNCRVSLRRPRQRRWVFLDTTPMKRRIAEGTCTGPC